jgi:phospholipid/cholesterol/gamma-HCH transport system substrate-binding protein
MSRDNALELKVGTFVLAAMAVILFFVTSISDFSFFDKGQKLNVIFSFANGLREASPVRLAGVEAGVVKKILIFIDDKDNKKTKVRATILLNQGMHVPKDSTFTINQLGLLGEKYIEIIPGQAQELLADDSETLGRDPVAFEKITEQVSTLTLKLNTTVDGVNSMLNEKNKKSIENMLESLSIVAQDLKEGRGTAGKILHDESIYKNLEELTADLKANPWKLLYRPKKIGK